MLLYPTNQLKSLHPFNTLGPEPLGDIRLSASVFHAALKRRTIPIKNALLDQRIIAGLENIYASEALWQDRLSPRCGANTLRLKETKILLIEIQNVLRRAISAGALVCEIMPNQMVILGIFNTLLMFIIENTCFAIIAISLLLPGLFKVVELPIIAINASNKLIFANPNSAIQSS